MIHNDEPHAAAASTPQINDVICGRGADARNHPGNKRFRLLINIHCDAYKNASKSEKTRITKMIVDEILANGGRFMKRDMSTMTWQEIDSRSCREKTGQSLREMAASKIAKTDEAANGGCGVPCSRRGTLLKLQQYLYNQMKEMDTSTSTVSTSQSQRPSGGSGSSNGDGNMNVATPDCIKSS